MKSKFTLTIILFMLSIFQICAAGAEYSRNIKKGWTKSSVTALKITNKFGEVKINDLGGDSVTIKVIITIDNLSGSKAEELMNKIHVNFQKTGGLVSAETEIGEDFRNNKSFSIDYQINIPKDRELSVTNKYGNVIINELDAKGYFSVSYGSLTSGNIKAPAGTPVTIIVNYGKADLESISEANIEIKYSKLFADEISRLTLNSKYSGVNLHKVKDLNMESKYDAISIDEVNNLKSESKYSNYKVGLLTGSFLLDTEYGSVRINEVDPKFSQIKIANGYGGLNIALNDLSYKLQADCNYCDIIYPVNRFKGNKSKENQHLLVIGTVGSGGGSVMINSRYGGVKLSE